MLGLQNCICITQYKTCLWRLQNYIPVERKNIFRPTGYCHFVNIIGNCYQILSCTYNLNNKAKIILFSDLTRSGLQFGSNCVVE